MGSSQQTIDTIPSTGGKKEKGDAIEIAQETNPQVLDDGEKVTGPQGQSRGSLFPTWTPKRRFISPNLSARLNHARSTCLQELFSLLVSAAALLIIVFLLRMKNGKPKPTNYSLNVIISILGTVAGLGCMHAAGSSITQLKWPWIKIKRRKLEHFAMFDRAGRSEIGATEAVLFGRFKFG